LCVPRLRGSFQRLGEIVKFDVIRVLLRRVWSRMTHQSLQCYEVASALAQEAVRESMPKLMRREATNAGSLTDAPDHSHQRLCARRLLRVLRPPCTVVLRDPLFDFNCKDVVIKLRLERAKGAAQLCNYVAIKGEPMPMQPFAMDASPAADEVDICPSTAQHLGTPKSGTFHQENRRPLSTDRSATNVRELLEARAIDVWLPLRRTTNLPRRIHIYEVLSLSPRKK
jgi:hypothetical protein